VARETEIVRQIFAELRKSLDSSASAADVLKFSTYLAKVFSEKTSRRVLHESEIHGATEARWRRFEELPIDVAMRDGGWKIYEYEKRTSQIDFFAFGQLEVSGEDVNYSFADNMLLAEHLETESINWLAARIREDRIRPDFLVETIFGIWELDIND